MNSLFIIHDEKIKNDMDIKDIFDDKAYDSIIAVTYSASAAFINKYLNNFNKIQLVVGIPEPSHLNKTYEGLTAQSIAQSFIPILKNEPVQLYQDLKPDILKKLNEQTFEMLTPTGFVIHSKFYLLHNSKTKDNRIIIGSSNLSEAAFNKKTNQLETILIYDNSELFNQYNMYFTATLKPILSPYFPKALIKLNKSKIKENQTVILLDAKEISEVTESGILEKTDQVINKVNLGILPEETITEMKNIQKTEALIKKDVDSDKKIKTIAYELTKEVVSTRTKIPKLIGPENRKKVITKKLNIKINESKFDDIVKERPLIISKPSQRDTENNQTGLFIQNTADKSKLNVLGKQANTSEISNDLRQINKLIESYKDYTMKYENTDGIRIFESILYAFTAPFIHEIRQKTFIEEERNDIPQFLILGGESHSGKSSLLKILSKLTAINEKSTQYYDYSSILPKSIHNHGKQTIDQLYNWLDEPNVAPLMVDEIIDLFFTRKNYGGELIVNITNKYVQIDQPFPVFIGTTNSSSYSLEERARRRSYYLKFNNSFNDENKQDAQKQYLDIFNNITNKLFLDFIIRISEKLEDLDTPWNNDKNTGKIDFLYQTREIFKDYYKMSDLPIPEYFSHKRYDDSKESNQEKWRKLFMGTSHTDFKFDTLTGNLLFKTTMIDVNSSQSFSSDIKPSVIYINALAPHVVVGSKDGTDIELDTELFCEWIKIENPYEEQYVLMLRDLIINSITTNKKAKTINLPFTKRNKKIVKNIDSELLNKILTTDIDHYTINVKAAKKYLLKKKRNSFTK